MKSKVSSDPLIAESQKFEVQYRNSAKHVSSLVDSWLGSNNNPNTNGSKANVSGTKHIRAKDVFTARPTRLGVGAKFIPHNQVVYTSNSSAFLSKEEQELKTRIERKNAPSSQPNTSNSMLKNKNIDKDDDSLDYMNSRSFQIQSQIKTTSLNQVNSNDELDNGTSSENKKNNPKTAPTTKKRQPATSFLDTVPVR
ncbi:hypothetical protein BB560_000693 [Smittium megazygosporum]|uniref:Uncharacterized protein n=1 Tax=Smittium megazygosporum TaxID=133381 RepID=A0A2T9ZJK7_9FUNG|nr:hypothetical protein BB560_000693 [Smittium megazygosporum]